MKLRFIALWGVSVVFFISSGMQSNDVMLGGGRKERRNSILVAMPGKQNLQILFDVKGLDGFAKDTDIIQQLAGTQQSVSGVSAIFKAALFSYARKRKVGRHVMDVVRSNVNDIIEVLCK